jgi:hypothetical protein
MSRISISRRPFANEKADTPFLWLRLCHELADRIEANLKLVIVFLLQLIQLSSQARV